MKLTILKNPNPLLRVKTVKIKNPLAKEVQEFVLNMIETMYANNGVGLAATQVGSNLRVCVIETEGVQYVLINPQITAKSKIKVISEEGCLSFPGKFFPISRHREVQVRYVDQNGKASKLKGRDLLSRAIQHELDHLDGVLIIDRVKKTKKKIIDNKSTSLSSRT
ncbi:MAG: Peptide deformylase [Candidatus Moranbacteria bacterium GW2011_GWE1_36_7]|nr:MAG: Peptide deformylase [Candidatus Moranbacteria bacterium GW2011_GWD2_36_12]KKQ04688.1 MAG: Peptide deformylase [Candidatus Moranbacteria bacterium GW2011_GWE2_36_40]KKQ11945.1 MAG: Peptide deformylase [Candidatus Moranbacteria bacterium GW2011_GWE1_36_7]